MDREIDDPLLALGEFRELLHLSPSGERKKRREQDDWPPHLVIAGKIFFRRSAVTDWLERQEAKQVSLG